MACGGSAGHSTAWGLNIDEGQLNDPDGRRWEIEVLSVSDCRGEVATAKEQHRRRHQDAKREVNRHKILRAVRTLELTTKTKIRERCGFGGGVFNPLWADLLEEKAIIQGGSVRGGNRQWYDAHQLAPGHIRIDPDNPGDHTHRDTLT